MIASPTSDYAFPERALRRWADRHLVLTEEGGDVLARFRFEGSTCGNIAFQLDYFVRVGPAAEGRRLLELTCRPAPGDDDHAQTCAARADIEGFRSLIERDKPLIGHPLDSVLAWRPRSEPSGCLCSEPFRLHKWQAVLTTLHFALSRRSGPRNHEDRPL